MKTMMVTCHHHICIRMYVYAAWQVGWGGVGWGGGAYPEPCGVGMAEVEPPLSNGVGGSGLAIVADLITFLGVGVAFCK